MNKLSYNLERTYYYLRKYGILCTIKKIATKVLFPFFSLKSRAAIKYRNFIINTEPTLEELEKQRNEDFKLKPKISIIVPMYKTKEKYFKDLIACLKNQTYSNWELCLADGSPEINSRLEKYYIEDERIKYKFLNKNGGISENTNEALKMVTGDYVGLLDHDDVLPIFALYEIVKCINQNPNVEFIYTDEDKINEKIKNRCNAHFKPDYAPETLSAHNYITHFVVLKKDLMDKLGGFKKEYDGAQDFDLVLRASELTQNIIHIPKILYHWRIYNQSTAKVSSAKPYAYEAGRRAAEDHQKRLNRDAIVKEGGDVSGIYDVEYKVIGNPQVSILIPNKDNISILKKCVNSIFDKTTYSNFEIIIIENNSEKPETFKYYEELKKNNKIKILECHTKEFNYSKIINFAVKNCNGDFILQLNNDTELITPDWLEKFIGYAQIKEIGAVGARLYFNNNSIQHAGIAIGIGGFAANLFTKLPKGQRGYFGKDCLIQNLSAVTGACLFCRKEIYEEVGYMDEENFKISLNDVDFCLKIREKGYRIVYNPYIELMHYESFSRGNDNSPQNSERFNREINIFKEKWKQLLANGDPYYNINLSREACDYSIKNKWEYKKQ